MPILDPNLTIILKPEMLIMADTARIDGFTKLECGEGITLEHNVHIASYAHLNVGGGKLTVCEGAAVASGGKIITGSNMLDAESCSAATEPTQQRIERWEVTIGKNATIFAGGIAMSDLGEGACLAANGFLPRNTPIPAYEIWGGTPARKIGERNPRPTQRARLNWDDYFAWHCKIYKCRPEIQPITETQLVSDKRSAYDFRTDMIEVWGKAFDKRDKAIAVPMQFVEVLD